MSIKKLFDSNKPNDILKSTNLEEEVVKNAPELESADNIREQIKRINRFVPHVDFSNPEKFVVYGSAQSYYEDAINRITNSFPYDGSEEEITAFHNESNYLDLYIFDNEYPRTTGYINLHSEGYPDCTKTSTYGIPAAADQEYIKIVGGPHTASSGMPSGSLSAKFTGSNYYDTDIYDSDGTLALGRQGTRDSNLRFDLTKGVTVEFWLKKYAFNISESEKEIIFDLWNGQGSSSDDGGAYFPNAGYGRLTVYLTGSGDHEGSLGGKDPLRIHIASGSNVIDASLLSSNYTTSSVADKNWHHYAISVQSDSSLSTLKSYVDGKLDREATSSTTFKEVTGSLKAFIGALQTSPSGNVHLGGTTQWAGAAPLSASLDDFRYWKTKRDEKDVQNNWWTQVRGGSNSEIANAELGVYYKFNEGITNSSSVDATVLDYSGRISNGIWINYPGATARNTGSAMVSASAANSEYHDPIVYPFHSDVHDVYDRFSITGSTFDDQNGSSILDSVPNWAVEDDAINGDLQLKKLSQIIGSYFDALNLQVQSLPRLAESTYLSASYKPAPFARSLLSSRGLLVPEIFVDADLLERFAKRNSDTEYNMDVNEVKNLIYQNIYNNLNYIYKSKGTEKAFRNIMHCYGIGEEIIKFNAYGNNATFKFEDTHYDTVVRKNYIDFNHTDRFDAVVYQNSSSSDFGETNTTYISGTNAHLAFTSEVEVIFPRKFASDNKQYFTTPFGTSSIFGTHTANSIRQGDYAWISEVNDYGIQLYAVRPEIGSSDAYFLLTSRRGDFEMTSSIYSNIYDNQKWNFAVRVKNDHLPYAPAVSGSSGSVASDIIVDWYGVNVDAGVVRHEFNITSGSFENNSVPSRYLSTRRRYYIGAERANTVKALLKYSDVKISSVRHYSMFLENEVIRAHALDPDNFGTRHPTRNFIFSADTTDVGADNISIPASTALSLHWDFSQVTGSDSYGAFSVEDASSGSISLIDRYKGVDANRLSSIITAQHAGRGYFPNATDSSKVVSKEFVQSAKQRLPEVVNSADAVNVLARDDELYPRDAAISQTFFAFEKSMYGIVSQEILNLFATIIDFNNMIGDVVHKYRGEYKSLRLLRNLFFEKIENEPDLDKFIDYYKWIDSSLNIFLQQFVPASANVSEDIRTMIEDHVLTRSKYRHQYPMLDYKGNERWGSDEDKIEGRARGINELTYRWKFGHAPIDNEQSTNALWWQQRAKRNNTLFYTSDTIDTIRQSLNDIILSFNSASAEKFNTGTGKSGIYEGSTYATRRFATPVRMSTEISKQIRGGYNFPNNQKPDAIFSIQKRGVGTARYDASKGSFRDIDVTEVGPPILRDKRKHAEQLVTWNLDSNAYETNKFNAPAIIYSSSAGPTGYRSEATTEYAGYHFDTYGDDYEVPMQGPFTEDHVGGNRHRHVDLNPGTDGLTSRPEAWSVKSGIFRANDSGFDRPSTSPQYRRDETAKRPVNIKNIQHRTGSSGGVTVKAGNYNKIYEVVQTSDRRTNNAEFVKQEGFSTASVTTDVLGYVSGLIDYAKPSRPARKHVFVERFSAPGGPEVAGDAVGGPGLDYESGQYSPYNNLNYRNTTVRKPLRTLLKERSLQFGLRSGSAMSSADYASLTASYHKIHRNTLNRLEFQDSNNSWVFENVYTASVSDNYYIQHMIPRSDYQYSWITASYETTNTDIYGYLPYDGLASASATGYVSAINFITASELGTGVGSGGHRRPGAPNSKSAAATLNDFVHTDFVGLNTTIVEPLSASDFTLGFPLSNAVTDYYNWGSITGAVDYNENGVPWWQAVSTKFQVSRKQSFVDKLSTNLVEKVGGGAPLEVRGYTLNNILSHRNGPYGYPTWKQIRVGQGPLARYYRKNNLYTHTPLAGTEMVVEVSGGTKTIKTRYGNTMLVSQSAVTTKYLPLEYDLAFAAGTKKDGSTRIKRGIVKTTFGNNMVTFEDPDLANILGNKLKFGDTAYRQILRMYKDGATNDPSSPIQKINSLKYKEVVYPSSKNMYTTPLRGRYKYVNNFWRSDRIDRSTKGLSRKTRNSANLIVTQSAWALDTIEMFSDFGGAGSDLEHPISRTGSADDIDRRAGELQNEYVHYHGQSPTVARAGALYSRKHVLSTTGSIVPSWGMKIPEIEDLASPALIAVENNKPGLRILHSKALFTGDANWDAPEQAGRYTGSEDSVSFLVNKVTPFNDTFDDWYADMRNKFRDHSIVPEFRISDHIKFYRDKGDDFLSENLRFLSFPGSPTGSRIPQNSDEDGFFSVFTNSDFMKYFEIIRDDHLDAATADSLTLRCRAVKKFIPYDGFYPAERTIQMSNEFITAISGTVTYPSAAYGAGMGTHADANVPASIRPLLKTLFAPGILYNTIKSGVAVDYPVLTGSGIQYLPQFSTAKESWADANVDLASYGIFSNGHSFHQMDDLANSTIEPNDFDHGNGWDNRIPFEALVEPENYLAGINIRDDEPSPHCKLNVVNQWSGESGQEYKQMMNNFLAESMRFFLKGGQPTTINSVPEKDFKTVTPGVPYGMRIKMWRSMDKGKLSSGSWGSYPVPQNTREILYADGDVDPYTGGTASYGASTYPKDITSRETLTMYSRPSAFGPPIGLIANNGGADISGSIHDFAPVNGVYPTHTPPYYDGECWFDIIYWPKGLKPQTVDLSIEGGYAMIWNFDSETSTEPYKPTLDEIFAKPVQSLFYDVTGSEAASYTGLPVLNGSFRRKWRFDQEELRRDARSTYWNYLSLMNLTGSTTAGGIPGPAAGPWVNKWSMQLDASLNIFKKSAAQSLDKNKKWTISTKFETPVLNFQHARADRDLLTLTNSDYANATIPRGMWHQFGRLPTGSEGIYIQVTDIPQEWLDNHPSASLIDDPLGVASRKNSSTYIVGAPSTRARILQRYYSGYSLPVGTDAGNMAGSFAGGAFFRPAVQSLREICGFSSDPVQVGQIRNKKFLSECVVAVPFVEEEGERKFFRVMGPSDPNYETLAGQSVKRQVEMMKQYVFPPTFDFVHNPAEVAPLAMYVFEFKHKLTKNDLSHIWQNLPPKIGTRFRRSQATVSHKMFDNELLGSLSNIQDEVQKKKVNTKIKRSKLPEKLQWMVFKVKKRAARDYFEVVEGRDPAMPFYTYNWPYDYCSLVELAQIRTEVEFKSTGEDRSFDLPEPPDPEQEAPSQYEPVLFGAAGTYGNPLTTPFTSPASSNTTGVQPQASSREIVTAQGAVDAETAAAQSAAKVQSGLKTLQSAQGVSGPDDSGEGIL